MGKHIYSKREVYKKKHPVNLFGHPINFFEEVESLQSVRLNIDDVEDSSSIELSDYGIHIGTDFTKPDIAVKRMKPHGFEPLYREDLWGVYHGTYSDYPQILTNIYNDTKPFPLVRFKLHNKYKEDYELCAPINGKFFMYVNETFHFSEKHVCNFNTYQKRYARTELDGISCCIIGQIDIENLSLDSAIIHDVLYFDGEDYTSYSYDKRCELLEQEVFPVISQYFPVNFQKFDKYEGQENVYAYSTPETSMGVTFYEDLGERKKVRVLLTCLGTFVSDVRIKHDIITGNKASWIHRFYFNEMLPAYISDVVFTKKGNSVTIEDIHVGKSLYRYKSKLIDLITDSIDDVFDNVPKNARLRKELKNIYVNGEKVELSENARHVYRQLEDELRYLLHTNQSSIGFAYDGFGKKEIARWSSVPGCAPLIRDELQHIQD